MKKVKLIYNPTSGKEKMRKYLPYVVSRLEQAGYEVSAHMTTGPLSAFHAAVEACREQFDLVVAAGGDGTIYEVINGLAEQPFRPNLGIIPVGTTNDFASALKIPRKNIEKICDCLCEGHLTPIDVGKANDKYFCNVAAGGAMTDLTYEVPIKLKTFLGRLAYYLVALKKIPFIRPIHVKIDFFDHTYEQDILFFFVCNTNSVGGFDKVAPNKKIDDGVFDLLVVEKMKLPRLVRVGLKTLKGKHLKDAKIRHYKVSEFTIQSNVTDLPVNLDGEHGTDLPTHFKILKHHLQVIVPKENIS